MSAYAIDPTATEVVSTYSMMGAVGVTLSDEPQLLEVNLVHSNGSPALTRQYLVDMLPQPGILSMQEHFVSSGRQMLPLIGVADLKPGDLVGIAHAPLLRFPRNASKCLAARRPCHGTSPWPNCRTPGLSCHKFACHR